jgi:alkylhydroperoxidase family enzyme
MGGTRSAGGWTEPPGPNGTICHILAPHGVIEVGIRNLRGDHDGRSTRLLLQCSCWKLHQAHQRSRRGHNRLDLASRDPRAGLELTEQGTRVADGGGVYDEAWANAAKHFDADQLGALVCLIALIALICLIALINLYNRLNVITRQPAGDYTPGQWG